MAGFANPVSFVDEADLAPLHATLGEAAFTATTIDPWTPRDAQDPASHGALLIWLGGEDYLIAGEGVTVTVAPADGKGKLGFDWVEEGRFENGRWLPGRRLNGDQTHQGRHVRLPGRGRCAEVPALPVLILPGTGRNFSLSYIPVLFQDRAGSLQSSF